MTSTIHFQHLVVNEGISAALALALLDEAEWLPGAGAAWTALAHVDKHALLHDRTLSAATDDGDYTDDIPS